MTYGAGAITPANRVSSNQSGSQAIFLFEHIVWVHLSASLAMEDGQKVSDLLNTKSLQPTHSVEHSLHLKTDSTPSKEIPNLLWNLKIHCHVHKTTGPDIDPDESIPHSPTLFS